MTSTTRGRWTLVTGQPGSGKTTIIEGLAPYLKDMFVIQGDVKSDVDTKRLQDAGIDCYQIETHSGCHLNAHMIHEELNHIDLTHKKYLIVENVGNLVCPAGVFIGQHMNILVNAVTEGNDKPEKYPLIFKDAQAIVLSKYDLKDAVEFNEEEYLQRIQTLTDKKIYKISKKDTDSYKKLAELIMEKSI